MNRRAFLLGSTMLTAVLPAEAAAGVMFVYVGGWDCPYCTVWKNEEKAKFLASEVGRRVRMVEIDAPLLKQAYQERYWPEEVRPVLAQVPHKSGTPRFLVVKNGKLVANAFGNNEWSRAVEAMRKALG